MESMQFTQQLLFMKVLNFLLALVLTSTAFAQFENQIQTTPNSRQFLRINSLSGMRDFLSVGTGTNVIVDTFNELATIPNPVNGRTVICGDIYKGGIFYMTNSVANTNTVTKLAMSTAGWSVQRIYDGNVSVRWFGAEGDGTTDDSDAWNAAIAFMGSTAAGGIVHVPPGDYVISESIVLYPRVTVKGVHGRPNVWEFRDNADTRSFGGGPSRITVADGMDAPLFILGGTNLYVWQASEGQEDGDVADSKHYGVAVEDLNIFGNSLNQTRYDCHIFKVEHAWSVTIKNITYYNVAGYAIWAKDVNWLFIDGLRGGGDWSKGKGVLLWGCADGSISNGDFGGHTGPGLWVTGSSSFQYTIHNNFIYNSFRSLFEITNIDLATGEITVSPSHVYETGMLTELHMAAATNTVPTGLIESRPYWVTKTATNKFKLSRTESDIDTLTYIVPTDSGVGTNYFYHGYSAGAYFSWNAGTMVVNNNRFDQNQEHGAAVKGGQNISFSANSMTLNQYNTQTGLADPIPAAGLFIGRGSAAITASGNVFRKLLPKYAQEYGILVEENVATFANRRMDFGFNTYKDIDVGDEVVIGSGNTYAYNHVVGYNSTGSLIMTNAQRWEGDISMLTDAPTISFTANNGSSGARFNLASGDGGFSYRFQRTGTNLTEILPSGEHRIQGTLKVADVATLTNGLTSFGPIQSYHTLTIDTNSFLFRSDSPTMTVVSSNGASGLILNVQQSASKMVRFRDSATNVFEISRPVSIANSESYIQIYWHNGAGWVESRVSIGAADSAGSGYRTLRIPN